MVVGVRRPIIGCVALSVIGANAPEVQPLYVLRFVESTGMRKGKEIVDEYLSGASMPVDIPELLISPFKKRDTRFLENSSAFR